MCDTALGAYDAEQTNRSSSFFGEWVPDQCAVLGAWPAAHVLVRRPVSRVGRLTEVCWAAYVKTSRCVTLRPGLGSRMGTEVGVDGTFHVHRPDA